MGDVKLGLQIYSLREAFAENPVDTINKIAGMGYEGIEFAHKMRESADFYRQILVEVEIECFGWLVGWDMVKPDVIMETIEYNRRLGSPFIVIGSIPTELISTKEELESVLNYMKTVQKMINDAGFYMGFHNHESDFLYKIDGKTLFEHIFDNMPESFIMLLDTGNAIAGGYNPAQLIQKHPHRSPFVHIKGYSKDKGYLAYIGDDDIDWIELIDAAICFGDVKSFSIEFGKRNGYDPFERAATSHERIRNLLSSRKKM